MSNLAKLDEIRLMTKIRRCNIVYFDYCLAQLIFKNYKKINVKINRMVEMILPPPPHKSAIWAIEWKIQIS